MSKIMTKESKVILSGRYDREGYRTRVVIPEYRLDQCVNMAHWPEQPLRCLEEALSGHPYLVDRVVRCPGMTEGLKVGSTPDLRPELRLAAYDQTQFVVEMKYLISAIHEHSRCLARMLGRTNPLWVGLTWGDIPSDLATIAVVEVGEWESRPIWVAFPATWEDMSLNGRGLVTPAGVAG